MNLFLNWAKKTVDEEIRNEKLKRPLPTAFFFNVEEFNVVSLEYDHENNLFEVCYILNDCEEYMTAATTYETYLEHLERLKNKIKSNLGE